MHDYCVQKKSFSGIVAKAYMMPMWKCEVDAARHGRAKGQARARNLLFDLGANLYWSSLSSKVGGSSQPWFLEEYGKRGLPFDRVFAWEAEVFEPQRLFNMPPHALDALS